MYKWKVASGGDYYQVWRQTRPLERGEPMHSGVRENSTAYQTREEAQAHADKLNEEEGK